MNLLKTLAAAALLAISAGMNAKVTLHPLFTDNMVLQQQSEVNIWGTAAPKKTVTVATSWNNAVYRTAAGADGKWNAVIATPAAGGPYTVTVSDGKQSVVLDNVLIGEVWICTGQSNMEMKVGDKVTGYEQEMADASKYKNIRLLHVENRTSPVPDEGVEIRHGGWQECTGENIFDFSAAGYFFGKSLNENLDVPVGLIETCWGGTYAESWTSAEGLSQMPYFHKSLEKVKTLPQSPEAREAIFKTDMTEWTSEMAKAEKTFNNGIATWGEPGYDASGWTSVRVPDYLQDQGFGSTSGFFWLRKEVEIPSSWAGSELKLDIGVVDDNDFTYFNGVQVGHTEGCLAWRTYIVPASLVKAGKAVVAVRVMDTGGKGGIVGDAANIALSKGSEKLPLAGEWKYRISLGLDEAPEIPVNTATEPNFPTFLYNAMINPLVKFRIRGAIWYQGEANVARADQYSDLLPLMINDWRSKWGYDFPFYIAQLANFMKVQTEAENSEWAALREAQTHTLHLDNTGMAVLIDIGEEGDIHPKNKPEVGRRLALNALALTYGKHMPYSGPIYRSYAIEYSAIRIMFDHVDGGLLAGHYVLPGKHADLPCGLNVAEELEGFYIAGADRVFHKAQARIEGNTVVVFSDEVKFPVAVRYGWADNPVCNLYNGAGLPASPFRTDSWRLK